MSEDQIKAELDRYLEAFSENRTVLPETNRNNTSFILILILIFSRVSNSGGFYLRAIRGQLRAIAIGNPTFQTYLEL